MIGINHDQPVGLGQATLCAEDDLTTRVTPGTSALFLTSENAVVDRVRAAFARTSAELIHTNRRDEQEAKLRGVRRRRPRPMTLMPTTRAAVATSAATVEVTLSWR